MGQAVFGSNTTIKISSAMISGVVAGSGTTLFYTVPANSYLILQGITNSGGYTSTTVYVCPTGIPYTTTSFVAFSTGTASGITAGPYYCPAGTRIYVGNGSGVSATFYLLGQLFTNSP